MKTILISRHLGPKMGHYFVPYNHEFVITVIVIAEFDFISDSQKCCHRNCRRGRVRNDSADFTSNQKTSGQENLGL